MSRIVDLLMSRVAFFVIVALAIGYFVYDVGESLANQVPVRCWNWPNITITLALLLALHLARQIDRRMREALHQLWLQGTIPEATDPRRTLQARILEGRGRKEAGCAVLIMLVMIIAYAWSEGPYLTDLRTVIESPQVDASVKRQLAVGFLGAITLGVLSGLVAGAFFGRLATYGSMATVLADPKTALNIRPTHFDGANGLKPVGDFYLYQALLTAIPLIWLAGWAVALRWYFSAACFTAVDPDYVWRVRWQFYGQWLVVASFTYLGFIRPVLALRRRLTQARDDLRKVRIPQVEAEIARLKNAISEVVDFETRDAIEARIHDLAREHWAIRTMSCWPMDRSTFTKYAPVELVSNVAPILVGPLLSVAEVEAAQKAGAPSEFLGNLVAFISSFF